MEFKPLPKDIFSIIRTYIHPYEIEMLSFPSQDAGVWTVEQHWYIGIIHILQTLSYAKPTIDAIIASNDETMVLILWEHRDLWQQWDYLSLMDVVTILTAYNHEITECDYLSDTHLNVARMNGASRIGNLASMRRIFVNDKNSKYSSRDAIQYGQIAAVKLLLAWNVQDDMLEYAVQYGQLDIMRMMRYHGSHHAARLLDIAFRYTQPGAIMLLLNWDPILFASTAIRAIDTGYEALVISLWNRSDDIVRSALTGLLTGDLRYQLF